MPRYAAFLRAINVGGRTVKMDRLRAVFEGMGFAGVATYIASGNVLFDAASTDPAAVESQVEAGLKGALGYEVATFVRTPSELAAIVAYQPFAPAELDGRGHALYVTLLRSAPRTAARAAIEALRTEVDEFHVRGRALYRLCRGKVSESPLSVSAFEKAVGVDSTTRNVTTLRKIAARCARA